MTASETQQTEASVGVRPGGGVLAIVAAYNEAERIVTTIRALARAFPGAALWVADDGSSDGTAEAARAAGARVVRSERVVGKGGAMTLAAREALACVMADEPGGKGSADVARTSPPVGSDPRAETVVILCDGDLGESAALLGPLAETVQGGEADLAVAAFVRRVGGGLGLAVGFAGWAIRRRCGLIVRAPISGQRAMRAGLLEQVLPLAPGFGMEIGMTIDAARAGARVGEVDLDLSHRATGRTLGGFLHRGRQLIDFVRVYMTRR
jgi:glycosyltransferase involved in cell wall biosynthesis